MRSGGERRVSGPRQLVLERPTLTVTRFTVFDLGIWCCVWVRVTLSEPPGSGVRAERFGAWFGRLLHAKQVGQAENPGFGSGERVC